MGDLKVVMDTKIDRVTFIKDYAVDAFQVGLEDGYFRILFNDAFQRGCSRDVGSLLLSKFEEYIDALEVARLEESE